MIQYSVMICPICNQTMMVPIVYGRPSIDDIMLARADKIVLGGVDLKPFTHFCHYCQTTYPEQED